MNKSILISKFHLNKTDRQSVQTEFTRIVNRGIILGFVWILGVGSVIALISGFQAKKISREAGFELEGKDKITKCFLVGIGGFLLWAIAITIIIVFRKK